jgi:hypothetical protein
VTGRPAGAAGVALTAARTRLESNGRHAAPPAYPRPEPMRLTAEQREEALKTITEGGACRLCAGIHAGSDLACPRLASFELDGDGNIRTGAFWADGSWDRSQVISAADIAEDDDDGHATS